MMVDERNIAMANKPKDGEEWVMECTLKAKRTERLGNGETVREVEWKGFATKRVVDAMLALFAEEVSA